MSRKGKPITFQFYASDWLSDAFVRMLTPHERGLYIDLLCYAFQEEGLPVDPTQIGRMVGQHGESWEAAWQQLERFWPTVAGDRRMNPKLATVIETQRKFKEQRAEAGRRSARQRATQREANERSTSPQRDPKSPVSGLRSPVSVTPDSSTQDSSPPQTRARARGGEPDEIPSLPLELDTDAVRLAWNAYERHRKQKRSSFTAIARSRALKKLGRLAGMDPAIAVRVIEQTLANGWTGLFPLDAAKAKKDSVTGNAYLDSLLGEETT